MIWIYFAGLLTPVVICFFLVIGLWSFAPNSNSSEKCHSCVLANFPAKKYAEGESRNIIIWAIDLWHLKITAHRRIHRYAWQVIYESQKNPTKVTQRLQTMYGWNWDD